MADEIDPVSAYLANKRIQQIEDYVRRGRQMASLPIDDLNVRWIHSFNAWATDRNAPREWEDVAAEYQIRGLTPPFDLVMDGLKRVLERSKEYTDQLYRDPEQLSKHEAELEEELERFRKEGADKPRN